MTNWIRSIAENKARQYKAGEDAAEAMYAAGSVPLAILKEAIEAKNHHPSYAAGMEAAAYRMEASELGGLK